MAPAPIAPIAAPTLAASVEEGEVLVGETLLSLRVKEFSGGSLAPPLDKEVEMLEAMNFDETDKLHLFVFHEPFVCLRPQSKPSFFYFLLQPCLRRCNNFWP